MLMRIDPKYVKQVTQKGLEAAESKEVTGPQAPGAESPPEVHGADEAVLSSRAQEIQVARQALEQLPAIREDRVAELKRRIKTGTYNVSAEDIAGKMLEPE